MTPSASPFTLTTSTAATLRFAAGGTGALALSVALAAAGIVFATLVYRRTEPELAGVRRAALTSLRALALFLLVAMLAEPVLQQQKQVHVAPGVLVLTDDSGSMGIEGEGGMTRAQQARALRDQALTRLRGRGEGARLWAGEGSTRLHASVPLSEAVPPSTSTSSEGTDLPALLISAAQHHLEDNLAAILLLTDGVTTAARSPSLQGIHVPVYAVAVGDSIGPADLRLDRVRYPPLVYRGETLQVDAEVVADGIAAGSTTAVLRGERGPVDSVRVQWPQGGGRFPITFRVRADSLGMRSWTLRVEPAPGEHLQQNNAAQVGVEVRKERLRLVLLEERPSWNFHFLARRTARDRRFKLTGVYRAEDGWRVAGTDSSWTVPTSPRQARRVDTWIAGSLTDLATLCAEGSAVPAAIEGGAGLLVLLGEAPPGSSVDLSALPRNARDLLPLGLGAGAGWVQGRYRVRVTPTGRGHPVMLLPPELGALDERLNELPPLWQVLHGATLTADTDELLRAQAEATSTPLLVVRKRGQGTVAAWLGAPLWSWSFWRLGETQTEDVFEALLGNLLYFLAEGGDRTRLRLVLPRPVFATGEDVMLHGLALDPRLQPDDVSDVWLEWLAGEVAPGDTTAQPTGRAPMQIDPHNPGGRTIALPALPPGRYALRLAMEEKSGRVTAPWSRLEIDPYSVEFRHPQVDRASLTRIAQMTGGRTLRPDELDRWARELPLHARDSVLTGRIDLWDSLWLLLPLLGSLAVEWALRKRWGLV